jgi:GTPase SAR1 family protein
MTPLLTGYEAFQQRRRRVAEILSTLAQTCRRLDAEPRAQALDRVRQTLESDDFKILIAGEFKRGKSTLINALLGCDVLPAKVAPCTAVITRVRFAATKRATLFFKEAGRPPQEIAVEDLKKYVVIQDDGDGDDDEAEQGVNKNPYARAEIGYPLALLRNNVEVVDSPGLNEHRSRTEVTREFLTEADAMVMVLSCQQALSQSELTFIKEELKGRDAGDVFFLWNYYDAVQDSPEDFADLQERSRKHLPRTGRATRIFFVSAKSALRGRKEGRSDLVEASHLPRFEAALEEFLSKERGRAKLRGPQTAAENAVRALAALIPERAGLLKRPVEELREEYQRQRPRLDEAERQAERMLHTVERRRELAVHDAQASFHALLSDLESGLRVQASALPINLLESQWKSGDVKKRLAEHLQTWIKKQVGDWKDATLAPLLEKHLKALDADLNNQAHSFLKNLEAVRAAFTLEAPLTDAGPAEVSPLSRVLGAVGGLWIGGPGSAMEGASMGAGQMAKGLGLHVAVYFGLVFMGFGLPVIVPVLAAIGIARTLIGARGGADKIREQIVSGVTAALRSKQKDSEAELQAQIGAAFEKILKAVSAGVKIKINEVRGQVQSVVEELERHKGEAKEALAALGLIRREFDVHAKTLENLRTEMEDASNALPA